MDLGNENIYQRNECALFLKTKELFGGLSNMAAGYPLLINGIHIPTSEALYQACRFPHKPELQKVIIGQKSPMTAKMKSKPYRKDSRPDWDAVRIEVMWWCLRVKLAQHWEKFADLLLSTGNKPIVEESYRDQFWGATPVSEETLVGMNVLGQLLTNLRELLKRSNVDNLRYVEPPVLPQFFLIGKPVGVVSDNGRSYATMSNSVQKSMCELLLVKGTVSSIDEDINNIGNNDTSLERSSEIFIPETSLFTESRCIQLTFDFVK